MFSGHYHPGLVALSLAVATAAAYVALDLAGRVTAATGRARRYWLCGGATAMGAGIWSMHYIGMLAYELPVAVRYDVPTVVLSLVPALLASGLALFLVSRRDLSVPATAAGSLVMGLGIAAMHFVGMEAMRLDAAHTYDPAMVAAAVGVAVSVSWVALRLTRHFRAERRPLAPLKVASALLMGAAVAGMHYTGMAAASFAPGASHHDLRRAVDVSAIGIFGVTAVTGMVMGLALLSSHLNQRFGEQAEAIRASEERYRLLFNRSLAGVYQSTLDGVLLDCNDALARILGFASREDVLTRPASALYSPDDRRHWIDELVARRTLSAFEHPLKRRDGALVWVMESATLVDPGPGRPATIEGTVIDITLRRDAEHRLADTSRTLAASLERYRTLVETTNAVPWEIDAVTTAWRYLSPQVERIFGYNADLLLSRPFSWDAVHDADRDRVRRQFATFMAAPVGSNLEVEYRLHRLPSGIALVRAVVVSALDGDGHPVLRGITLDITAQRQLEVELHQAQKLESVGRLAAGVAHEINTPVQFVSDSLHFARDGAQDMTRLIATYRELLGGCAGPEGDALRARALEAEGLADLDYLLEHLPQALVLSLEGLDRVARIVRSMKEFAHADDASLSAVDINQAIESTLIVARHEYRFVAEVETDFAELPPVTCHGGEVNQAVLNVLVNAAHAIADRMRGTDRLGRIGIRTRLEGGTVVISIADNGGGIPEDVQPKVFDPFFTTKPVGKGTGQGLAIARAILVDRHGGDLRFETRPGEGTTFHLHLPLVTPPAQRAAA
jgi:PAS domain S-box-containing protein